MIVDFGLYGPTGRKPGERTLAECIAATRRSKSAFVWIALVEPTVVEFDEVVAEFELHPLAVEDAIHARQRPKLEQYGDTLFLVVKPARYVDSEEVVQLSQVMLFLGPQFVITVRHGECGTLGAVRRRMEADPENLRWGPIAVFHAILDAIVDEYGDVLGGVNQDVDEVEDQVFSGDRQNHAERLYKLKREVVEFRHAVAPLAEPLARLAEGRVGPSQPVSHYFRDVHDHVLRIRDRIDTFDDLLTSALSANLAQVSNRQNEDMRRISAWVAILAVPTMIAGIYGMNFEHMPELEWTYGYPAVLLLMVVLCSTLYVQFRRRNWL